MKTLEKLKQIKEGKWSAEQNIRSFLESIKESDKAGKKLMLSFN